MTDEQETTINRAIEILYGQADLLKAAGDYPVRLEGVGLMLERTADELSTVFQVQKCE